MEALELPRIDGIVLKNLVATHGDTRIYSGYRLADKRHIAVKTLRSDLKDKTTKAKFLHVAQFLVGLEHPNLIHTYSWGKTENDLPYLEMEFVKARSLKEIVLSHRRIRQLDAVVIIEKLAATLAYLHNRKIIHCDVKPGNILFESQTQRLLLTSFGLAQGPVEFEDFRPGRPLIGTYHYMAPEQIRKEHVSEKTDIYSLGICFYRLLCNQYPFHSRKKEEVLTMHLDSPFPDLPEQYRAWNELIKKMCDKSEMWRPNAIEVLHAIKHIRQKMMAPEEKAQERRNTPQGRSLFSLLARNPPSSEN